MAIAITLKEFLEEHEAHYKVISHARTGSALESSEAAHVPGDRMVKTVLLGDDQSYVLALLPATHRLDIERIRYCTGRELSLITEDEIANAFADCETGSLPPIGDAYGMETLVDRSIAENPDVYFESGDHELLVNMSTDEFMNLLGEATPQAFSHHI